MPSKPNKMLPALYGGIILAVISNIPFLNFVNCLCCAGVLFGGFMAVFFYKNELGEGSSPLASSDGIQLGALAGLFGAVIGFVLQFLLLKIIGNVTGEAMFSMMENMFGDKMPPESLEQMREGMTEGGVSVMNFVVGLIINPIFGLLGGLIGFQVFKPKTVVLPSPPPQR
jgi:hypothetical protein